MALWQDNTLQRITELEDRLLAQAQLIHDMSEILVDVSAWVMLQTAKENSLYDNRGQQY